MTTERMTKARTGLIISQPFFGTLAMRLDLIEDPNVKNTVCNGKTIRFNPDLMHEYTMPEVESIFAHQVLSCALGHHLRRGGRDAKGWNEASDYVVNAELKAANFILPPGALYDAQYDGMHVEAVYASRQSDMPPDAPNAPGGAPKPGGDTGTTGQGQSSPTGSPGGAGEGATGALEDAPGDAAEQADQRADWEVAVSQAAQVARGQGKLPGGIERQVQDFMNPKVDWREALARFFQQRARDDSDWSRPNRRFAHMGLYLPSMGGVKAGTLAFAYDASGSIGQEVFDQFSAEVEEVRVSLNPEEIVVLVFDTQVRAVHRFGPHDPIVVKSTGGGGTSFTEPPRTLEQLNIEPEALVYLTDLDCSSFPPEPSYPVLWVSTDEPRNPVPFGEVVVMQ